MDIEAIRKRMDYYQKVLQMEEGGVILRCEVKNILEDANELLGRISRLETEKKELESRLRWKMLGEEKPPETEILLRNENDIMLGFKTSHPFEDRRLMWYTPRGLEEYDKYSEWREI
jgi:hypothetical protein